MDEPKRMIDAFPNWKDLGGGIFQKMLHVPWDSSDSIYLDKLYFGAHSGDKWISPFCHRFLPDTGYFGNAEETFIALWVEKLYLNQWERLWAAATAEYNPISNYDMTETETAADHSTGSTSSTLTRTGTETTGKSGTETHTLSGSDTTTRSGSETLTRTGTETNGKAGTETSAHSGTDTTSVSSSTSASTENDIYGFNSSTAAPANSGSASNNGQSRTDLAHGDTVTTSFTNRSDTLTRNTTDKTEFANRQDSTSTSGSDALTFTNRSDTLTRNTSDQTTGSDTHNGNSTRTLTRSGNIGVTTSAQMISGEIELWKWNFYESVFADVDKILTLGVY